MVLQPSPSSVASSAQPTLSPVTPSPTSQPVFPAANFATFLKQNCLPSGSNDESYVIARSSIPLTSSNFPTTPSTLYYNYPSAVEKSWFTLGNDLIVYGPQSEELGHGGAAFIGEWGALFRSDNNIRTFIYIDPPHACGLRLNNLKLQARTIKTLRAQDGSSVYILKTSQVAATSDPRLVELYRPYLSNSPECGEIIQLDASTFDQKAIEFLKSLSPTDEILMNITTNEQIVNEVSVREN